MGYESTEQLKYCRFTKYCRMAKNWRKSKSQSTAKDKVKVLHMKVKVLQELKNCLLVYGKSCNSRIDYLSYKDTIVNRLGLSLSL